MAFKRTNAKDLAKKLDDLNSKQTGTPDPHEWTLTTDAQGRGSAILRFLPPTDETGHTVPFVKIYNHGFKSPKTGKWFIENCPTTLGQECPVCALNGEAWQAGDQDTARRRKRKLSYWANVMVVKDESNPEAEGKVFKYRFGQKIYEKIMGMLKPEIEEQEAVDVTDPWDGANFYLKAEKVAGFQNYDKSQFGPASPLFKGDDAKIEALSDQLHDLSKIVDPKEFKSEEEMLKNFNRVEGETQSKSSNQRAAQSADDNMPETSNDSKSDDIPWDTNDSKSTAGGDDDDDLDSLLSDL